MKIQIWNVEIMIDKNHTINPGTVETKHNASAQMARAKAVVKFKPKQMHGVTVTRSHTKEVEQ